MPNIKQQKKRVRTAADQRLENLRYRSTIKTLTKRLVDGRREGDAEPIEAEHKALVKLIDRAVARGALHRNAGGAQEVAGRPRGRRRARRRRRELLRRARGSRSRRRSRRAPRATARGAQRARSVDQRALELELAASREPPFSAWSSSASRTVASRSSSLAEVPRLREELLRRERVHPRAAAAASRGRQALLLEPPGTRGRRATWFVRMPTSARDRRRARVGRALEQLSAAREHAADVARAPGVGEVAKLRPPRAARRAASTSSSP